MGIEREHKLLVRDAGWQRYATRATSLRQGYLSVAPGRTVRVRLVDGEHGYLTIKGARIGDSRPEFEYEIPPADARAMLDHQCLRPLIEKTRHHLDLPGGDWTVDEFHGDNAGLVLAEVELAPDATLGELPDWAGDDVTEDDRYANSYLQEHPYTSWA